MTQRNVQGATPRQHLVGHWRLPDLLVLLLNHYVDATQQLAHTGSEHLQVGIEVVVTVVEVVIGFLRDLVAHLLPRLEDVSEAWGRKGVSQAAGVEGGGHGQTLEEVGPFSG